MNASDAKSANPGWAASVLFAGSIVALISMWMLNKSIYDTKTRYNAQQDQFEAARNRLARFRSYRAKTPDFYRALVIASLTPTLSLLNSSSNPNRKKQQEAVRARISLQDGTLTPQSIADLLSDKFNSGVREIDYPLLGTKIQDIISQTGDVEHRHNRLRKLFEEMFTSDQNKRFSNDLFTGLSKVDSQQEWPKIAEWIVFGVWHPPTGGAGTRAEEDLVSYRQRYRVGWTVGDELSFIWNVLAINDPEAGERFLYSDWLDRRTQLAKETTNPAVMAVPGLGTPMATSDLLFVFAPILAALEAVYVMVRIRRRTINTGNLPFGFPQFHSESDPLRSFASCNVNDLIARAVWSLFLLLPIVVVTAGILFRYDIATIVSLPGRSEPVLATALRFRQNEFLSNFFDWLNLCCGIALLGFTAILTKAAQIPDREQLRIRWITILTTIAPLPLLVWLGKEALSYNGPRGSWLYSNGSVYSVFAFIILLIVVGVMTARRNLQFVATTCAAVLILMAAAIWS